MKVRRWLLLFPLLTLLPSLLRAAPDQEAFRAAALKEINAFRHQEGSAEVRLDETLDGLSLEWARQLAGEGRLQHRSIADMKTIQGRNGYGAFNENLFMASDTSGGAAAVIDAWKHSPGHRRNLLQANIDRIGISAASAPGGGLYAVFNGAGGPPASVFVPGAPASPPGNLGASFGGNPLSRAGANDR